MTKANDSGQALVEAAISLSILLMLVFGTFDYGYLYSTKLTLQNAVRQAGRYAITGQCITGTNGSCSMTRYNSIIQTIQSYSLGMVSTSQINISCTDQGGGCPNSAGGPGDLITISVTYPYNFLTGPIEAFFPSQTYTIKVSAAFTNEIFPPSAS